MLLVLVSNVYTDRYMPDKVTYIKFELPVMEFFKGLLNENNLSNHYSIIFFSF